MADLETGESARVIAEGRAAWGDEYAQAIFGTIVRSVAEANIAVQPPVPVDTLRMQIAEFPRDRNGVETARMIGLHDKWSGFSLLMDAQDPAAVLREAETTVFHETARVAIFQHRKNWGYYRDNTELDALGESIESGMVIASLEMFLEPERSANLDRYVSRGLSPDTVKDTITQLMGIGVHSTDNDSTDIEMGDPKFPRMGYRVGHAIVLSAMIEHDLSVHDMLAQSPEFYALHARKMVDLDEGQERTHADLKKLVSISTDYKKRLEKQREPGVTEHGASLQAGRRWAAALAKITYSDFDFRQANIMVFGE